MREENCFTLKCEINGEKVEKAVPEDASLLYVLREILHLTGTKEGCGEGECGACTVVVDGKNVNSCIFPAIQAQGSRILTIEGVEKDPRLARIQKAFVDHGAVQCGFCSPGMILSASVLLAENPHPTSQEIRRGLSGNTCRCTGYQAMVDAVKSLG
ncbi:MAG TPA: (2Fe-2S)-binding protein [Candidatus Onthocola gallistercoris]|uniref:(2Fe-2S)-binding protein n=1 Tax=Candidatus Onthocola gallistercoris TaxID=2840876 RepID=A0A9D1HHV0_9FIRM|nr:(2Fe-2S)-binding protein [Candidatus Onthocola gallistercoris]